MFRVTTYNRQKHVACVVCADRRSQRVHFSNGQLFGPMVGPFIDALLQQQSIVIVYLTTPYQATNQRQYMLPYVQLTGRDGEHRCISFRP